MYLNQNFEANIIAKMLDLTTKKRVYVWVNNIKRKVQQHLIKKHDAKD